MKKIILSVLMCCVAIMASAQIERPKLVVGLVVDQMRWDYLYYYYDKYGEGGMKRLLSEGFSCENQMLNYVPTVTGVGHASIYTGAGPATNGIAANDFYLNGKRIDHKERIFSGDVISMGGVDIVFSKDMLF